MICWVGGGWVGGLWRSWFSFLRLTLDTSSILRWMRFILRWTRLLSASWPEEKRSAGAVAKRILQHTFLVPTAIKQRFSVDPSRIAVSKDTKMIVDLWQTPGFEQKEIKTDLKKWWKGWADFRAVQMIESTRRSRSCWGEKHSTRIPARLWLSLDEPFWK